MINKFARTDCQLPGGWEKKVEPHTGKVGGRGIIATPYISPPPLSFLAGGVY